MKYNVDFSIKNSYSSFLFNFSYVLFVYVWQSITFDRFIIQAGADLSGVATSMVSMNSTVKMTFRNTATFFGVHVASTPLDLNYYQLTLATGNVSLILYT